MYVVSRSESACAQPAREQSKDTPFQQKSVSMLGYETRCMTHLIDGTQDLPSVFAEVCATLASISQRSAD